MKSTSCCAPGTVVSGKYSCFAGLQWTFAILAPSGNGLPLPGTPPPGRRRSSRDGEEHSHQLLVLAGGDNLPTFVSPELGEREATRYAQGVLVLLRDSD